MKEVTKIHIAKVPYEIEVVAKKQLQEYIEQLETYAADAELFNDIEIRITEILAENGVHSNGVISQKDVTLIKDQLGQPTDFLDEEDERALAQAATSPTSGRSRRRLYRDEDGAVIAGVVAGLAKYIGISQFWSRVIALLLLVSSFGSFLIVYVVLWLVVPPARSAAEKLEMAGKPVTLSSIKEMGEELTTNRMSKTVQAIIFYAIGFGLLLMALASLLLTAYAGFGFFGDARILPAEAVAFEQTSPFLVAQVAFILSGLLLAALSTVLAVTVMRRKWTKRIGAACIAIIISGLLAFSTGIVAVVYGDWSYRNSIERAMVTSQEQIDSTFSTAKSLSVQLADRQIPVQYVVDTGAPRYELTYMQGKKPTVNIKTNEGAAVITLEDAQAEPVSAYVQPSLRVYGPALENLEMQGDALTYVASKKQDTMNVVARKNTILNLEGSFAQVEVAVENEAQVNLEQATIARLDVAKHEGDVNAGVVNQLSVAVADACAAAHNNKSQLTVESVTSDKVSYNGTIEAASSKESSCSKITIEDKETDQ